MRSHIYIFLLRSIAKNIFSSSEKTMLVIGSYDPDSWVGVVFGKVHRSIGSVPDDEANNVPDLDNTAD